MAIAGICRSVYYRYTHIQSLLYNARSRFTPITGYPVGRLITSGCRTGAAYDKVLYPYGERVRSVVGVYCAAAAYVCLCVCVYLIRTNTIKPNVYFVAVFCFFPVCPPFTVIDHNNNNNEIVGCINTDRFSPVSRLRVNNALR
jgi:hypothetical protein